MNIVADNAERGEAVCKRRLNNFDKRVRIFSNELYIAVTWEKFIIKLIKIRNL